MKKILSTILVTGICLVSTHAYSGIIYSTSTVGGNIRDISATGTQINLGDDQVSGDISLGFNFNFYDVIQSDVRVSSNGFLDFAPDYNQGCCTGDPIPSTNQPNGMFAGLWEDLDTNGNTSGTMFYQTLGAIGSREFIVGFYNVAHFPNQSPVTFEMILHETTNNLEVQFGSLQNDGIHTIGIENYAGTEGIEFYRGTDISQFSNSGVLFEATATSVSVPEPGSIILLGIGLAGLGLSKKRKLAI